MKKGKEPTCLIDFWMQETVKELIALSESGETVVLPPPNTSNVEIGSCLFDFLFAAQDASTSSLLWAMTLFDSHLEVLAKVSEEVKSIWLPEFDSLINSDQIVQMMYTHVVAREILRYRAPMTIQRKGSTCMLLTPSQSLASRNRSSTWVLFLSSCYLRSVLCRQTEFSFLQLFFF